MTTIEAIKEKLQHLDAGNFQILCDAYLSKIGYPYIVSLGTKAGTQKTTLGTPDTYFYPTDSKYVFAEYTTQKDGLPAKIRKDIEKCLDESFTGIAHDRISEIVYCHTSSNLTPRHDNELRKLCKNVGIKLTLIGIDQLAEDIDSKYHSLAKKYLHLSIDTEQIQTDTEFVKQYNANRLAAPLDTPFLFREKELNNIDEAFQHVDVVILTGAAGTGKTRLALQYAKNHALEHKEQLYCIHDRALPLYDDLKLFIDKPGHYFLFVDDANQLSALQHVVEYVNKQDDGYNVKILITVRDYAIQKVIGDICGIAHYELLPIKAFSDDEIKKMLKETLGILNSDYQDRIVHIAEGNARIAMLAGKIACKTDRLSSIDDVSQLYTEYYGTALREANLDSNIGLIISAGIIAFLNAIHLDYIDSLIPILSSRNLNKEEFVNNIYKLNELEIVDVYHDKAVCFSEQCFANFILKYVFYDKKLLNLADMVETCFSSYQQRTISSISTLLGVFKDDALYQYVEDEIRTLWSRLAKEKSPVFLDFVRAFFPFNRTEALLILQEKITSESSACISINELDTEKGKNEQSIKDDILSILGGFADSPDLDAALDLYFQYYLKRPDKFMQFYHTAIIYYCIHKDSSRYGYYTQITFIKKISAYSDCGKNEFITILFLEIAGEFLKLKFSPSESGLNNHSLVIYNIPLTLTEGVKEYRSIIWTFLLEISQNNKYTHKIKKILNDYGRDIKECSVEVVKSDIPCIIKLLNAAFPPSNLSNCLLAHHIKGIMDVAKMDTCELKSYLESEKLKIYHMLQGPAWDGTLSFEERRLEKAKNIQTYISTFPTRIEAFKKILDICNEFNKVEIKNNYSITNGLMVAFQELQSKQDDYITAVKCYIELDTPLNLHPIIIVNPLFSMISADEVLTIIISHTYSQKNAWLFAYYHELPQQYINTKRLEDLYTFLKDKSDTNIHTSPLRDVDFLDKYNTVDANAFICGCRIILSKMSYSPFMANIYFASMFSKHHDAPHSLVKKFSNDMDLLEDIYIKTLLYDEGEDYDGRFLREIYLSSPSIINRYVNEVLKASNSYFLDNNYERNHAFFDLENSNEIYDSIIDEMIKSSSYPMHYVPHYIKSLVIPKQKDDVLLTHQDAWIRHYICTYFNDGLKMNLLFIAVSELTAKRRLTYITLLLNYNQEFDVFDTIPLIPTSYGCFGNAVPLYSSWIDFLQQLLPFLSGLKFVKHKNRVENIIERLRKDIAREEIGNILEG